MESVTPCHMKVTGMYCTQCERRIAKTLEQTEGISNVKVSYRHSDASFLYDEKIIQYGEIVRLIEAEGYGVAGTVKRKFPVKAVVSCAAIAGLFILLQHFGVLNLLAPAELAQSGMGYGTLFGIGLITSVHCIAMCGGINLSQSLPDGARGRISYLPALLYNSGRVVSYTLIGVILGTVGFFLSDGSGIAVPLTAQGIFKLAAGTVLFIMGIRMLGIFPWLQRFSIRLPRVLTHTVGKTAAHSGSAFIGGLLNGIMPCGPLQAMWLIALSSGSPWKGGVSMLLFSLGTVPLMMGLGVFVTALGKKFTGAVQNAGAVVVAVMGLALFSQGGVLSGILPVRIAVAGAAADTAVNMGSIQIVESELKPGSYPEITVESGVPVQWRIHADKNSINGCNYSIVCQKLDFTYEFHAGDNLIQFTPTEAGDIDYSCWMGMIYGTIHVTDEAIN